MKKSTLFVAGATAGLIAPQFIPAAAIGYGVSIGITWLVTETAEAAWKRWGEQLNAPAMYHAAEVVANGLRRFLRVKLPFPGAPG